MEPLYSLSLFEGIDNGTELRQRNSEKENPDSKGVIFLGIVQHRESSFEWMKDQNHEKHEI